MYLIFYSFIKDNELFTECSVVKFYKDLKEELYFINFNGYSIDNVYFIEYKNVNVLSSIDLQKLLNEGVVND